MEQSVGERWRQLCEQIAAEQNPELFAGLFDEICLLLEQREAELLRMRKEPPKRKPRAAGSIAS